MVEGKTLIFDLVDTLVKGRASRPGAVDFFRKARAQKNRIVVASSMPTEDIGDSLFITGLFNEVDMMHSVDMSPHQRKDFIYKGKLYLPVLESLGLRVDDASAHAVTTGDKLSDYPADVRDMVFIHDSNGVKHDFSMYEEILDELNRSGEGHMYQGFKRRIGDKKLRIIPFGNGVYATLSERKVYRADRSADETEYMVPTVTIQEVTM